MFLHNGSILLSLPFFTERDSIRKVSDPSFDHAEQLLPQIILEVLAGPSFGTTAHTQRWVIYKQVLCKIIPSPPHFKSLAL